MLFVYQQRVFFKIHTVPSQAKHFSLPQPSENSDEVHQLVGISADLLKKRTQFVIFQRLYLLFLNARQRDSCEGIVADVTHFLSLFQSTV